MNESQSKFYLIFWSVLIFILSFSAVLGLLYYFNNSKKVSTNTNVTEREVVDTTNFTKEDTLNALAVLNQNALYKFEANTAGESINQDKLPEEITRLMFPARNTEVKITKSNIDKSDFYTISYQAEQNLTINQTRLLRLSNVDGSIRKGGLRSDLASIVDLETENFEIHIEQLAVSEDLTSVTIYAKAK